MKAVSLGYHDVTDTCGLPPHKRIYTLETRRFKDHLDAIRRRAPAASIEAIHGPRNWSAGAPVFLTFDDGRMSSYTLVADELEARGWRGHFFIVSSWVGRSGYLDRHHLRELARRGHVIGSHTATHPERMSSLGRDELLREWSESRGLLSDILGMPVRVASVANGFYSRAVGETAVESGIQVLFTSTPTVAAARLNGGLILGRFSMQRGTPPEAAAALANYKLAPRLRQSASWYAKEAAKRLAGERYLQFRRLLLSGVRSRVA